MTLIQEGLFEFLGNNNDFVISACDWPAIPPLDIMPAVPASAENTQTVAKLSRRSRLESSRLQYIYVPVPTTEEDSVEPAVHGRISPRRCHGGKLEARVEVYAKRSVSRSVIVPELRDNKHSNGPYPEYNPSPLPRKTKLSCLSWLHILVEARSVPFDLPSGLSEAHQHQDHRYPTGTERIVRQC